MPTEEEKTAAHIMSCLDPFCQPERAKQAITYFPTDMTVLGISTPDMRRVMKDQLKAFRAHSGEQVLAIAFAILEHHTMEGRHLAYELIANHAQARAMLDEPTLRRLGHGMDNWASVDTFAVRLSGPAWRDQQIADDQIETWAHDDNVWWRRAAVVSTVPLNLKSRGGKGDTPRTLAMCQQVMNDHHDMIQKALSWALRELTKRDPDAVASFMESHRDRLAARVKREVRNKLDTGRKNPNR